MILGRPTNLWLGFVTAAVGLASVVAVTMLQADAETVATVSGALIGVLGALIVLVAGGQTTVNAGDTVTVATPKGEPNYEITA